MHSASPGYNMSACWHVNTVHTPTKNTTFNSIWLGFRVRTVSISAFRVRELLKVGLHIIVCVSWEWNQNWLEVSQKGTHKYDLVRKTSQWNGDWYLFCKCSSFVSIFFWAPLLSVHCVTVYISFARQLQTLNFEQALCVRLCVCSYCCYSGPACEIIRKRGRFHIFRDGYRRF